MCPGKKEGGFNTDTWKMKLGGGIYGDTRDRTDGR